MADERSSLGNRIFVDLFGPIVNIEHLEPFKDVYRARYLPLNSLVDSVNNNLNVKLKGDWFPKVDQEVVLRLCEDALSCYEYNPEIIDSEIINALVTAISAGTEVIIISTVPDLEVFKAAKEAICNYMRTIPGFNETMLDFEWAPKKQDWLAALKKRWDTDRRFTYVIHDTPEKEFGVTEEDGYNRWVPGSAGVQNLAAVIQGALSRERQAVPLKWLQENDAINLADYIAFGEFMVFDNDRRKRIASAVKKLKPASGKPTCVFLAGPPGSGKSFFVKQFIEHQCRADVPPVISNISGVRDLEGALKKHVYSIAGLERGQDQELQTKREQSDTKLGPEVAFIDEIDTSVFDTLAFRFLLSPMEGTVFDEDGFEKVKPFGDFTWFFAGSAGTNREDFHKLADHDRKVRDFTSRIPHWIELPGAGTPFDAMFMAITLIKARIPNISQIEKKVLLFFAKAPWRDARHLAICVDTIVTLLKASGDDEILGFPIANAALADGTQIPLQFLSEVDAASLGGFLKIVAK